MGGFDFVETGVHADACPQGFGDGFLGGEAFCQPGGLVVGAGKTFVFGGVQDAGGETVRVACQHLLDAGDFHDVRADAEDSHAAALAACINASISTVA